MSKFRVAGVVAIFLSFFLYRLDGAACPDPKSPFLQKCGSKLFYDGKEYRAIGLNFYTAFRLYLDIGWDDYRLGEGRSLARRELAKISSQGIDMIRVMGPFSSSEFVEVFFDNDNKIQEIKRMAYLTKLNEFLEECERLNIGVVFSLFWNPQNFADLGNHSIHRGLTDSQSLALRRFVEYTTAIVNLCRDRRKLILEIGNEYNFLADLKAYSNFAENGVFSDSPGILGGVYRGSKNNFNSHELASFFHFAISLIKSVDPNRLVVTGNAEPRPNAWHLFLTVVGERNIESNKKDSLVEHGAYTTLLESDADLMSSHYYINEAVGVRFYKTLAEKMEKPLFFGEVGPHFDNKNGVWINADYSKPIVVNDIKKKLKEITREGVSISLLWTYKCAKDKLGEFDLCYGRTDEVLNAVAKANRKIKKRRK